MRDRVIVKSFGELGRLLLRDDNGKMYEGKPANESKSSRFWTRQLEHASLMSFKEASYWKDVTLADEEYHIMTVDEFYILEVMDS